MASNHALFAARFFHLADHVVLLENSTVEKQGSWHDMDLKFKDTGEVTLFPERLLQAPLDAQSGVKSDAQKLKLADAAADLSRKTGDFSLYGKFPLLTGFAWL
jgi:ATP-binding cassette, subfamily C (CFTR/MRP), member 1